MVGCFRKRRCLRGFFGLSVMVFLLFFSLVIKKLDEISNITSRLITPVPKECPIPSRFHVSGEPELYLRWRADAYLLSGGINLFPGKAAYHPLLIGDCCQSGLFKRGPNQKSGFIPIINRTFADVSYRSSICHGRREHLAGVVRRKVEAAGFTFQATGLCGGSGYPLKPGFTKRGKWQRCGLVCRESKIMLSFERFKHGHHYLSEKLFLPLEYGAVPAYYGNGHTILDMLNVNTKAFIDRLDFESDEAFADKIVHLLHHPEELQRMQDEPAFHDVETARKRVMFLHPVGKIGEEGNPELYKILRENDKFGKFINGANIKIRATGVDYGGLVKHVLNISSIQNVTDPDECVDIEVHGCCF